MFTCASDKVYVGYIDSIPIPSEINEPEGIGIVLLASGYRDDKQKLKFTTDYSILPNRSLVYIKEKDIVSVRNFDLEIYNHYFSKQ